MIRRDFGPALARQIRGGQFGKATSRLSWGVPAAPRKSSRAPQPAPGGPRLQTAGGGGEKGGGCRRWRSSPLQARPAGPRKQPQPQSQLRRLRHARLGRRERPPLSRDGSGKGGAAPRAWTDPRAKEGRNRSASQPERLEVNRGFEPFQRTRSHAPTLAAAQLWGCAGTSPPRPVWWLQPKQWPRGAAPPKPLPLFPPREDPIPPSWPPPQESCGVSEESSTCVASAASRIKDLLGPALLEEADRSRWLPRRQAGAGCLSLLLAIQQSQRGLCGCVDQAGR